MKVAIPRISQYQWNYAQKPVEFDVEKPRLIEEFAPLVDHVIMTIVDGARYDVAREIADKGYGLFARGYSDGAWFENARTVIPSVSNSARALVVAATEPRFHGTVVELPMVC